MNETETELDWSTVEWRNLRAGEIILSGDYVDAAADGFKDDPIWKPVSESIGTEAPDPAYPAHRAFRRITGRKKSW